MRNADRALLTFLSKRGKLDAASRQAAEELMAKGKLSAAEALCDSGVLDEATIVAVFTGGLHLPRATLDQAWPPLPKPLDRELLSRHLAVPTRVEGSRLVLAMVNPLDEEILRQVRFASGLQVIPAVAPLSEIRTALHRFDVRDGEAALERLTLQEPEPEPEPVKPDPVRDSPIIKMADLIIAQALTSRASDIHLEPSANGLTVRYRVDGVLEEATRVSANVQRTLVTRFKVMARLDIAERRVPQDGRIEVTFDGRRVDCRVSTLPTQYGEKVVLRLLDPQQSLVDLEQLGFQGAELASVQENLQRSEGMILTTGPTGSGKSTTLYSMLRAIQTPDVNIVTVENPIEYRLPGITQSEVNERQGLTFAGVLRSILRQDPDVILVGEIRDRETAEIAIQAAQTGHLVLSTLHTNDAVGAVTRLANLGIERELVASSLLLVLAQRLVRRICPQCREAVAITDPRARHALEGVADTVYTGRGCAQCRNSGYRGRLGIYELFRNTAEAKRLITSGANEVELRDLMRREGGHTLMQVALDKLRLGQTTLDEIIPLLQPTSGLRTCAACGERIGEQLAQCPRCGSRPRAVCPTCQAMLPDDATACPACNADESGPLAPVRPPILTVSAPCGIATPAFLGTAVRALAMHGGLDSEAAAALEIAVVEACNLASNAFESVANAALAVEVEASSEGCSVCLVGEGPPWPWPRPSARFPTLDDLAPGDSPEVRAFLIRASADEVTYERQERTNRLWLTKRASAAPSEAVEVDALQSLSA